MVTAIRNTEHYFGACPECASTDGHVNVERSHWGVCDTHKTRWPIGANLFSDWRDETQDEWERNAALLSGYRVVEPLPMES